MADVAEFQQRRYRCLGCFRSWAKRSVAVRHAARCQRDPATRGCGTCAHYCRREPPSTYDPLDQGEPHGCAVGFPEFTAMDGRVFGCQQWERDDA